MVFMAIQSIWCLHYILKTQAKFRGSDDGDVEMGGTVLAMQHDQSAELDELDIGAPDKELSFGNPKQRTQVKESSEDE